MRRVVYLAAVALVAMLILAPAVLAQQTTGGTMKMEQTVQKTQPLPSSGGPVLAAPSVLLPGAALLLGSGVLAFAVLRGKR